MSDWIAAGSLVIAVFSIMISLVTSTKKYELSTSKIQEILDWFTATSECLIMLRLYVSENLNVPYKKAEILAKLSSLIEKGRFYFPNVNKKDGFGSEKFTANKGHRHILLDVLVYSYDIFLKPDANKYIAHLEKLQKLFTSQLFEIISPHDLNKSVKKYTGVSFYSNNMGFEDFLKSDPQKEYFINS